MSISPKFPVVIQKGQMKMPNRLKFEKFVQSKRDGDYILSVKKKKKYRSDQQNKYLWGVIYKIISDETGYLDEEVHAHLARKFLLDRSGKIPVPKSTTELSTMEFEEYTENCRRWGAKELGLNIPLPNEVDY